MDKKFLFLTFASIVVLGLLNYLGGEYFLYWDIWWYDLLVHFVGGFAIGLFLIYLFSRFGISMGMIVFLVFLVGVGWEVFEYVYDIAIPTGGNYLSDTFSDLLADILGALLAIKAIKLKKFNG